MNTSNLSNGVLGKFIRPGALTQSGRAMAKNQESVSSVRKNRSTVGQPALPPTDRDVLEFQQIKGPWTFFAYICRPKRIVPFFMFLLLLWIASGIGLSPVKLLNQVLDTLHQGKDANDVGGSELCDVVNGLPVCPDFPSFALAIRVR